MGKLIDVNKWFKDTFPKADLDYPILDNKKAYPHWSIDITGLANILNDAESVEAIPKDQYEARLKADLKSILVELQLEIEEMDNPYTTRIVGCAKDGFERGAIESQNLIQQKINALKGVEDDNR